MKYRTGESFNGVVYQHLDIEVDLVALEGSEKQIAWAEDIRKKYVMSIFSKISIDDGVKLGIYFLKEEKTYGSKAVYATTDKVIEILMTIPSIKDLNSTSAKYWIENR